MSTSPGGTARPPQEQDGGAAGTSGAEMLGIAALCLGLALCALAMIPSPALGPEAYAVPKELVLHAAAFVALQSCLSLSPATRADRADRWLMFALLWSALASVAATNHWSAWRSLSLTGSGLAIFWSARVLAARGHRDLLVSAVVIAGASAAATAVFEAHGLVERLSMPGRSPGGTIGHRNVLAHLLALSLPLTALAAIAARGRDRALFLGGCSLLVVPLVLSRSRGAWIAALASLLVAGAVLVARRRVVGGVVRRRILAGLAPALVLGVAAAVIVPTRLSWSSRTPFRDTLGNIANYESGTGRGRVLQFAATARMAARHPLLGVGPGNWRIEYPRYARAGDPSVRAAHPEPVNRLANNEWLSFAAERGVPAIVGLVLGGAALVAGAWRHAGGRRTPRHALRLAALLGVVAAAVTIGIFDAVLASPALLFFAATTLGVLAPPRPAALPPGAPARRLVRAATVAFGVAAAGYSGRQLRSLLLYSGSPGAEQLTAAIRWYPGDYRAHLLLGEHWIARGRCDLASPVLLRAERLYPTAEEPARLRAACAARLRTAAGPGVR